MKTVVGVFDDTIQAQAAIRDLKTEGFTDSNISLIANNADNRFSTSTAGTTTDAVETDTRGDRLATNAAAGAGIGAAAGGIGGLLLGLGALAIPGIGPIVAAGPLAAALAGAGIGAAAGGLIGALTTAGIPEEHAHTYAEAVRRGGHLVSVACDDARAQRAADILDRNGAVDVEERAATWRKQGWKGFDTKAAPLASQDIARERQLYGTRGVTAEKRVPVMEEKLAVGKREVERGGVRVYSRVVEQPVQQQVNLKQEKVVVERRPVDRPIQGAEWDSFREGTIEMTERSEEPVVSKQARVVEEVLVGKQVTQQPQTVRDTVRKTEVKVEPITGATGTAGVTGRQDIRAFETYDTDFRRDFQTRFGNAGYTYDQYMPTYRYGYDLASDPRFAGRDWDTVEPELRRDYEARYPGNAWDRAKASVRFAWDKVRGRA